MLAAICRSGDRERWKNTRQRCARHSQAAGRTSGSLAGRTLCVGAQERGGRQIKKGVARGRCFSNRTGAATDRAEANSSLADGSVERAQHIRQPVQQSRWRSSACSFSGVFSAAVSSVVQKSSTSLSSRPHGMTALQSSSMMKPPTRPVEFDTFMGRRSYLATLETTACGGGIGLFPALLHIFR